MGLYQGLINRNVTESAAKLGLGRWYMFQQDRDPMHNTFGTWDFFENNNIKALEQSPQSPDHNPTDQLLDHYEKDFRNHKISNQKELQERFSSAFDTVGVDVTKTLVDSMKHRSQAMILDNGGPISY